MKLQVLVATMNQTDYGLIQQMNLKSDAIIINQCNKHSFKCWIENGNRYQWYDFRERGVGLSRNNALMRADQDIILFGDDDVTYSDDYVRIILSEFERHPYADIILFNVESSDVERPLYVDKKFHRVHWFNCLRYGAVRIAVKRSVLCRERILFSLLFGGGAKYGSGEDTLFITDCLKHKLSIYASEKKIGSLQESISTWFTGYDRKYFFDKGALFAAISSPFSKLLCIQYCLRHSEIFTQISKWGAYQEMLQGIHSYTRMK